jgi:hypothetical protein
VLVAGPKVQRALPRHQPQDVVLPHHVVRAPAGEAQQVPQVAQPAGVVQQVADGDRRAEVRHFGDVPADVVVQREPALPLQDQHGHGGELLGDGADVERRLRRHRNPVLQIRGTVAARVQHAAVAHHADGAAGGVGEHRARKERVDARLRRRLRGGG